jgi:hypothetical protein
MPPDKGRQGMKFNSLPFATRGEGVMKNLVETIGAVAVIAADAGADGVLDARARAFGSSQLS